MFVFLMFLINEEICLETSLQIYTDKKYSRTDGLVPYLVVILELSIFFVQGLKLLIALFYIFSANSLSVFSVNDNFLQ